MKIFECPHCKLVLFFYNRNCGSCGRVLGYMPENNQLCTLDPAGNDIWNASENCGGGSFKFCQNAQFDACNWLIPTGSHEAFCIACRHNRTVPDLSDPQNLENWRKLEFAKHRLFYTLLRLNLPLVTRLQDPQKGLAFDFLSDPPAGNTHVLTGHEDGIITLALKEADDAEREKRRTSMHEPYRTLLGHFRHEIGHYYWDQLVDNHASLQECRAIFGDDSQDYGEALKRHYEHGAPANWQDYYVSAYAASHPWEDFAETWAHYLHIVDSLETAKSFGLEVHPSITASPDLHTTTSIDPYQTGDFKKLIDIWLPLTYAMNAMNRSMGLGDIYPFVLSQAAIGKLDFMHRLVHGQVN